jgi:fructose-1,6-bisphosphatase/sedoheptulose 1,7-bisphosphatase-like protein
MSRVVVLGEGEKDEAPMLDPSAVFHMDKLVTGPQAAPAVDITAKSYCAPAAAPSATSTATTP